jgi:hypothetical protein
MTNVAASKYRLLLLQRCAILATLASFLAGSGVLARGPLLLLLWRSVHAATGSQNGGADMMQVPTCAWR